MRSRRALSSVVGMVFAIIALTSTVVYITYSMNTVNQYNQSVIGRTQQVQNTAQENFQMTGASIVNGKFNITLSNTGTLPVNITKVWIQNTTAKDTNGNYWTKSFVPANKFAMPGNTVTNVGKSFPGQMISTYSYKIKLVTSRGNMQQFTMNSVSTPLNMQLLAMPPTVPGGFTTQLVMIVTNNSTGVLTNVFPQTPQLVITGPDKSTASCTLGPLNNPTSYNTLSIGQTAVFSWPLTASGAPGKICTYQAQLQGSNQVLQTKVSIIVVALVPSTTYATYSGILTINYTTFAWTQGGAWSHNWSFPNTATTDFSISLINNNSTTGNYNFWISKNSLLMFTPTVSQGNSAHAPATFYLVNSVQTSPSLSITGYSPDYGVGIPNNGGQQIIYFGSSSSGTGNQFGGLPAGNYYGVLVVYGKFTVNSGDSSGGLYAQTIPFLAVISQ